MADHGVYCSSKVIEFKVIDCKLDNISHVAGVFKVRASSALHSLTLRNIKAHNLNGYLLVAPLEDTPDLDVLIEKVSVTKDSDNPSVFYGFCFTDEAGINGKGYNARELVIKDCRFGYGYNGSSMVYPGSGNIVAIKDIKYINTTAIGSHFGGGSCETLSVKNCVFNDFCNKYGVELRCENLEILNTSINKDNSVSLNYLFFINHRERHFKSASLQRVEIDVNAGTLINIDQGERISIDLKKNSFRGVRKNLILSPSSCVVSIKTSSNRMDKNIKHNLISYHD